MIATPTYQYNSHSVYNRNQLGNLDMTSMLTYGVMAYVGYYLYKKFVR